MANIADPGRLAAVRRGRRLEYLTIAWNSAEAAVALIAGLLAGSIALIGFGLDSLIEVCSGAVVLWRLSADNEHAERIAVKVVGVSFLVLSAYVAFDSIKTLWLHEAPEGSLPGIVLAGLSLIIMPLLARAKRRVAAGIGSRALHADSRQTNLCAFLSAILLGGLVLNALLGWWWADPVAGLGMTPIIANEGRETLKAESCGGEAAGG